MTASRTRHLPSDRPLYRPDHPANRLLPALLLADWNPFLLSLRLAVRISELRHVAISCNCCSGPLQPHHLWK